MAAQKNKLKLQLTIFYIVGLLLAFYAAFYAAFYFEDQQAKQNEARLSAAVEFSLTELTREIQQTLNVYSLKLNNLRAFIYSAGIENLSHDVFRKYAEFNVFQKNYPGARGFGFIRYLDIQDVSAFIESASKDRGDDFTIRFLSEHDDSRFVIQYIEPESNNKQAIGLDIGSEANRRNAALLAASQNAVTLTAPITLVQADAKVKHGFLILLPLYERASLITKQDISNVQGWVYAPLLIDEILSAIQQKERNLHLTISDVAAGDLEFFRGDDLDNQVSSASVSQSASLHLFGRNWLIKAAPNAAFVQALSLDSPSKIYYQVLGLLSLVVVFLGNLFYLVQKHFVSLNQKSELAAVVENGIEGILGLEESFCLKYWNDAAKSLFGFTESNLGESFLDFLIGDYSADFLIDLFKRIAQGESIKNFEVKIVKKGAVADEGLKYLNLNFQPIFHNDTFSGVSVSMADVSEVRALHTLLEEKNHLLNAELHRQDGKLKQSIGLHDSLLQGADFLILTTDMHGLITSTNRKIEEVLEYSQQEILGESVTNILDSKYLTKLGSDLFSSSKYVSKDAFDSLVYPLNTQSRVVSESPFLHKDGYNVELELTVSSVKDLDGVVYGYLFIADDIREQKALKFDLELVKLAIQNAEDILLWCDERGNISNSNPFARQALQYSEYELKRINISDVVPLSFDDVLHEQLHDLNVASSITTQKEMVMRDGHSIPCLITITKLEISGNVFLFLSGKDISDRLAKERTLEEALNVAAQANLSKDQFLANMGHELRTPLNEVNGSLQLMQLTDLSSVQDGYLSQAKASVRALTQSIDDVLDCGEIIRNKLSIQEEQVELLDVINSVAQASSLIAEDKNIEVHFDIAEDLPYFIKSDAHRLYQLLMCLMNNAVKFTFHGDIVLSCFLLNEFDDQYEIGFKVKDSGVGISEEKQAAIFELFSQAEMGSDRAFGGLGLGLTISKTIVELMSGTLCFESQVDKGTTVSFNILVGKTQEKGPEELVPKSVSSLKVLVVDDNEISLSVLSRLIEQLGWEVEAASGANIAIEKLQVALSSNNAFDLALIDWNMPEKTGLELVKDIRKQFSVDEIPILVMVTAYTRKMLAQIDNRDVEHLLSAFLTKPITRPMLIDLVNSVLGAGREDFRSLVSSKLKLDGFRILLVEDNETNQFIAKNLLSSQGAIVAVASEGEQAWNILNEQPDRFDIVLMDIQMPGWDGYRATKQIRSDARFNDLPVLAMTANVLASDKRKCFDAGMNGHIGKPFELTELVQEILSLARKPKLLLSHRIATKKAQHRDGINNQNPKVKGVQNHILQLLKIKLDVNVDESLSRFAGSEALYIQSLNIFVKDLEQYMQVLTPHDEALSFEIIKPIFHTLKGTAGLLGFSGLANLSMECDQLASMLVSKGPSVEPLSSLVSLMGSTKDAINEIVDQSNQGLISPVEDVKAVDIAKFNELKVQLKESKMQAVELYAQLHESIAKLAPDAAIILKERVDQLDFKSALSLLEKIEAQYSEQIHG